MGGEDGDGPKKNTSTQNHKIVEQEEGMQRSSPARGSPDKPFRSQTSVCCENTEPWTSNAMDFYSIGLGWSWDHYLHPQ